MRGTYSSGASRCVESPAGGARITHRVPGASNGELLARHIFQSGYSTVAAVFALGSDSRKRVQNFNLDVQHG